MRLRHFILAAALLLLPCAGRAFACQCRERQPPCSQYAEADAVFVGSVTDIVPADDPQSVAKAADSVYGMAFERVNFRLERAFRGVEGGGVEVVDWMTSCRFGFKAGWRYLVYAYLDPNTKTLGTSYCTRTAELSKASADLAYLNNLASAAPETFITGLLADRQRRLRGVRVTAEGGGGLYRSASDKEGWFRLVVPKPGRYKVRIYLPLDVGVGGTEDLLNKIGGTLKTRRHYVVFYDVEVRDGTCSYLDVPLFIPPRR
ncbi:MAG: carboxypeptidase regulatory-like domain-containing protein [Acidobacteria bacterium]|nr:carboxypeptidase regulatory-like domain-containing protein [Acidobacteriota bacterium]